MVPRLLPVALNLNPAMSVTRVSVLQDKLCYLMVANKVIKYPKGRSRVVYIGTTQNGVNRVAVSAAQRADDILGTHGITAFDVYVVTCKPRQHVRTWRKLERALLLTFRETYGDVPLCNKHGTKMRETNEFDYFSPQRIKNILEDAG